MIPGIYDLLNYTVNTINNLNLTIIWSYQNAPRTDKPYIMIDYTDNDIPNFDHPGPIDLDGNRKLGSWRRATVSLHFYCGPNSDRIASQVALMLNSNVAVDKQVLLDVAIGNRLMLQRIPALLNNSQYEDRAIYQFDYYYTDYVTDFVGLINTVVIEGSYDGVVTCSETISVPYVDHRIGDANGEH